MIDYNGLQALAAVYELQSFGRAAEHIGVTQSAVSQRLNHLEQHFGQRLLSRERPYRLLGLGDSLITHFNRVQLMEGEIEPQRQRPIRLAVNRDSLDSWLLELFQRPLLHDGPGITLFTDDQELTLGYLQRGEADIAVSSQSKAINGCAVHALGAMDYYLVATPEFKQRYFPGGINKKTLPTAPAVVFDAADYLHHKYLGDRLGYGEAFPSYTCPSSRSFKQAILAGAAYGLMPIGDIRSELEAGAVIKLQPRQVSRVHLYIHSWQLAAQVVKDLVQEVRRCAKNGLDKGN